MTTIARRIRDTRDISNYPPELNTHQARQHNNTVMRKSNSHDSSIYFYCTAAHTFQQSSVAINFTMAKKKKVVVSKSKRDEEEVVFDPYPVPVPHEHVSTVQVVYCSRRSTVYSNTRLVLLVCVVIFLTYNPIPTVTMNT